VIVTLEVSAEGARALAALGWLAAERQDDPHAVAQAVLAAAGAATAIGVKADAFRVMSQFEISAVICPKGPHWQLGQRS